jgi:uncharacterized repeat protein (TIGR02543 family)
MLKIAAVLLVFAAVYYYNLNFEVNVSFDGLSAYANNGFSVTYLANGGDSGNAPIDGTLYKEDDEVRVLPSNNIARRGYTFGGWSLLQNGNGTTYQPGNVFWISRDITLFAKWLQNEYQVTYAIPNATGTAPVDNKKYTYGSNASVLGDNGFSRSGYTFAGWATQADGGGIKYMPGNYAQVADSMVLYAQWTAVPTAIVPVTTKVAEATPATAPAATPAPAKQAAAAPKATAEPKKPAEEKTETQAFVNAWFMPAGYGYGTVGYTGMGTGCVCPCCSGAAQANANYFSGTGTNPMNNIYNGNPSPMVYPNANNNAANSAASPVNYYGSGNSVYPINMGGQYYNGMASPDMSSYTYKAISTLSLSAEGKIDQTRYLVYTEDGVLLGSIYIIPESYAEMQQYLMPITNSANNPQQYAAHPQADATQPVGMGQGQTERMGIPVLLYGY